MCALFATPSLERLPAAVIGGVLIALCGTVAWVSGHPFLVPSLGPSAYLLAARPARPASAPHRVVGGHAIGTGVGLVSYSLLAPGLTLSALPVPLSIAGLRLGSAAVLSMVLTMAAMVGTGLRHPPACATTLLVALGLLSAPTDAVIMLLAVGLLVCAQRLIMVIDPRATPVYDRRRS
jgi:CBS-domain-containing membrane protein